MVWYSHLFQNFPQFIVIHTVKGFGIVNKAEIDVFLELSCFFNDPADENPMDSMKTEKDRTCCAVQPKKFKKTLMAGGLLLLGIAGITLQVQDGEAGRWPQVMKREWDLELHVHTRVSGKRPKRQNLWGKNPGQEQEGG